MSARRVAALVLLLAALAGCGSSGHRKGLSASQQQALVAQLEAVRAAADTRDVSRAQTALRRFRSSVTELRRAGALSDRTARELRVGAARILAKVKSDNPPAPPPTPTQTQSAPAPAPKPKPKPKPKAEPQKPVPPGHAKHHTEHGHGKGGGEGGD